MSVLALIPARAGSKGVPGKNIRPIGGKPLLAHSIEHARDAKTVDRVIVSTDAESYADVARARGAEVPFLRPAELARDDSTDLEVFTHALAWLRDNEGYEPEIVVHLRPTAPLRRAHDVDGVVEVLRAHPSADSVRSVSVARETPWKTWFIEADGALAPVIPDDGGEPYNAPRQSLRLAYHQNAVIDAVRARTVTEQRSMTGRTILPYVLDDPGVDIDSEDDFAAAAAVLAARASGTGARLVYCFDVDGVVASITADNRYENAEPLQPNIDVVNRLHDAGHEIVLFTARGTVSGIDWTDVTIAQLAAWGVRYDRLAFGKPAADVYVDDRMISIDQLRVALDAESKGDGGV